MNRKTQYDVAIIGGGLAGLTSAILLAKKGYAVVLFEKERYPFHKVCGEYISMESYALVSSLGLKLDGQVPLIRELIVSSPSGKYISHRLPLGGFGISRYRIDMELMQIAKRIGVNVLDGTRVEDVKNFPDHFEIFFDHQTIEASAVCAAYGKRSNLDIKWKRDFVLDKPGPLANYVGVKYHAKLERPEDLIELHNFQNGYCGISPVEDGKSCICYLTTADMLKKSNGDLAMLESEVLGKNPHLRRVFSQAEMLYEKPLTISQISFEKKKQAENGILFIGDAASMIAPLCGNGMSMALHAGRMAAVSIEKYLSGKYPIDAMCKDYTSEWNRAFSRRLRAGRLIQSLFGNEWLTNTAVNLLKQFPGMMTSIIRQTHGDQKSEYSAG